MLNDKNGNGENFLKSLVKKSYAYHKLSVLQFVQQN